MAVKKGSLGRSIMMFKTWMPKQIWLRFAPEQKVLESERSFKGRYRSHTPVSAAILGGLAGISLFNPIGAIIGTGIGVGAAFKYGTKYSKGEVTAINDLITTTTTIVKRALGIPLNLFGIKVFDNPSLKKLNLNKRDEGRLKANITEIAVLLGLLALKLFIKALWWDDETEDEAQKAKRRKHNLLDNKISSLMENTTQYLNPRQMWDNATILPVYRWLNDVGKTIREVHKYLEGHEYTEGEDRVMKNLSKTFLPSLLQEDFGFGKLKERDFESGYIDRLFWSEEAKAKRIYDETRKHKKKIIMKELGDRIINENMTSKEIWKEVNKVYPTRTGDYQGWSYTEMLQLYEEIDRERGD